MKAQILEQLQTLSSRDTIIRVKKLNIVYDGVTSRNKQLTYRHIFYNWWKLYQLTFNADIDYWSHKKW